MEEKKLQGVLLKAHGGFYFVQAAGRIYTCSLRGRLKQELKNEPLGLLAGDRVGLTELPGGPDETGVITELLPRRNFLPRPKIANVDQCLVVLAAQHPQPDYLLLDRLLVCLLAAAIQPIICFNKLDTPAAAERFAPQMAVYRQAGFTVLPVSALHQQGVAEIKRLLLGRVTAVAGQSGVGKSTLLNYLQPQKLQTGSISHKLQRGRHTTRMVELLPLGAAEGWIADTPGFSRLDMPSWVTAENLAEFWPDLRRWAAECRFDGCRHDREPDCRVKAAVADGSLDSLRYQRYLQLLRLLMEKNQPK